MVYVTAVTHCCRFVTVFLLLIVGMHTVLASIKNIFVIGQCAFYVKCGIVVVNGMELLTWFLI